MISKKVKFGSITVKAVLTHRQEDMGDGGVAMMDKSRIPLIAMLRVLGIGVAVSVKMSILARIALIFSFCLTPKRCSSSMISKPKSLYLISWAKSL